MTVGDDKKLQLASSVLINQNVCRDVHFIVRLRHLKGHDPQTFLLVKPGFQMSGKSQTMGLSLFADRKKVPDRLRFSRHMKTRL